MEKFMTDFRSLIGSIMLVSSIMIMAYVGRGGIDGNVDFVTIDIQLNGYKSHALTAEI